MTGSRSPGVPGPLVALWTRAPLWRLALMIALLASLLFVLFPPRGASARRPSVMAADQASYVSRPLPTAVAPVAPKAPAAPASAAEPRVAKVAMVRGATTDKSDATDVDPALLGQLYRDAVLVNGYRVPLPAGEWATLANSSIKQATASGAAHFLGRIQHRRLVGAVRIFAMRSLSLPGEGFNEVKSCTEVNPARLHVVIDDEMQPQGHQSCWTVRNIYATPWGRWADKAVKISFIDRAAAGDMAAKGVSFPQDFVAVTFTRTETWGLLEVMYLFDPEEAGISSNTVLAVGDSDWGAERIGRYPEKVQYVAKMQDWGIGFWPRFKAAFAAGQTP